MAIGVSGTITDPGGRPPPSGSTVVIIEPSDINLPTVIIPVEDDGTYTTGAIDGGVEGNVYDIHTEMIKADEASGPTQRTRSFIRIRKQRGDSDIIGSVLQSGGSDKNANVGFVY